MSLPKVFFLAIFLTFCLSLLSLGGVFGVDCTTEEECASQINQQNSQLTSIQQQQADLQKQLNSAQKNLNSTAAQLAAIQKQVDDINAELSAVTKELDNAQALLDKNKAIFRARVREDYINGDVSGWELIFGNSYSFADSAEDGGLRQVLMTRNRTAINQYSATVKDLSTTRDEVASAQKTAADQLAQIQAIKNAQAAQVSSIKKNQSSLSSQVAQISANLQGLTSKQQEIIAAKLAATAENSSVGNAPPPSTALPASPFHPGFVFFTYGYIHRGGMNQYGAYGRAKVGQNYQQILQKYYGQQATAVGGMPAIIHTDQGDKAFETNYMYGIAEMPTYWADSGGYEALKAQAVAARSYALASIGWPNSSGTICTSQSCQVYNASKVTDPAGAKWRQAVDETRGEILTSGNGARAAYYSSTDGGYTCNPAAWNYSSQCSMYLHDVDGSGQAYDGPSHGNSPWYHKAWGTNSNGGTAWLTATEAADIFNAVTLSKVSSSYNQYLSPADQGGWSIQHVKDQLASLGRNYVDSASTIGVGFDGHGNTSYIWVYGANGVYYSYTGRDFQDIFNIRSPGTLGIKTSLFDVQKSN